MNGNGTFTLTHSKNSAGQTYTVSVEYYDGYTTVKTFTVEINQPSVTYSGNSVEFTSLDGLKIIRYAKGNYTTATEIKNAIKNKYVNSSGIVDGAVTISDLSGEYTFFVQYNDGSETFIHHTF